MVLLLAMPWTVPIGFVAGALVPPGHLVAFGDNYRPSLDSKQIGYFPADCLVGVVLRPVRGR